MRGGGGFGRVRMRFSRSAALYGILLLAIGGAGDGAGIGESEEESCVSEDSWDVADVVRGRVIGANVNSVLVVGVESVGFGVNVVWDIVNDRGFHLGLGDSLGGRLSSLYLYFGLQALGRLNFSAGVWLFPVWRHIGLRKN
jgi:hypothetical protein